VVSPLNAKSGMTIGKRENKRLKDEWQIFQSNALGNGSH
jgi:hypothetical protein